MAILLVIVVQAALLAAGAAGLGDRRVGVQPATAGKSPAGPPATEPTVAATVPAATAVPTVPATPVPSADAYRAYRPPLEGRALYYDPPAPAAVAAAPTQAAEPAMEQQKPAAQPPPEPSPAVGEQPAPEPSPPPPAETVNAPFLSNLPSAAGRNFKFPDAVERWRGLVEPIARQAGIEPALVLAVIQQESGGDPHAVSRAGASGLMQLMPSTFRAYVPDGDIFDPRQNVFAGIYYLRDSLWYHRGDDAWALAGYNSGISGSLRMRAEGGIPWDYGGGETIRYIYAVWWNYYRAILAGAGEGG